MPRRLQLLFSAIFAFTLLTAGRGAGADAVLVTTPEFLPAMQKWITYRESQGYKIHTLIQNPNRDAAVSLFSGASPFPSPESIRDQIRAIHEKTPLSGILIVGDGAPLAGQSPDPNDPLGSALGVIPAPRVGAKVITRFGPEKHIAADNWYADLDSDTFPDIPIGRIPARTPSQAADAVGKILYYEQVSPPGDWQRRAALVAGMAGFSPVLDNVITDATRQILSKALPDEYDWTLVQANWKSIYCPDPTLFRYTVLDELNKGPLFWVYMGHGLHRELDRLETPNGLYKILELSDSQFVNCETSLPIMLFCACYTGAYDSTETCMAEEFSLAPKGPVAVIATSRTSMPYGMAVFGVELLEEIFERHDAPGDLTLGEYILAAKRRMKVYETPDTGKNGENAPETAEETADKTGGVNKDDRSEIRRSLDSLAKMFDPTAAHLDGQLEDHRYLFNLFGDPLLRVRFPKETAFTLPEIGWQSEPLTVSSAQTPPQETETWSADDSAPEQTPARIRVELLNLPTRPKVKEGLRKEYSDSDESRIEFQRTFETANDRVLAAAECETSDGAWSVELPLDVERTGTYVVRVLITSSTETQVGAKRIKIRKR